MDASGHFWKAHLSGITHNLNSVHKVYSFEMFIFFKMPKIW